MTICLYSSVVRALYWNIAGPQWKMVFYCNFIKFLFLCLMIFLYRLVILMKWLLLHVLFNYFLFSKRAKKTFIIMKEDRPYRGFGYLSLISHLIRSGKRSQGKYCNWHFNKAVVSKTDILEVDKLLKYFKFV